MPPGPEPLDDRTGQVPVIRAKGKDVVYELRIVGGELARGFWSPSPHTRLVLRCDGHGQIFVRIVPVPLSS